MRKKVEFFGLYDKYGKKVYGTMSMTMYGSDYHKLLKYMRLSKNDKLLQQRVNIF